MNLILNVFTGIVQDTWVAGAYIDGSDKQRYYFGAIAETEEQAAIKILDQMDTTFEEIGSIRVVTAVTNLFNFLVRDDSTVERIPAKKLIERMKAMNESRGTKFTKKANPEMDNLLGLARADMMTIITKRYCELNNIDRHKIVDDLKDSELKRNYKKVPDIFLGTKVFHFQPTEEITIDDKLFNVYFTGAYTAKGDTSKKDNNVVNFEKERRKKLYTYYTGSNAKLTDAGQRSLEEVRSITLAVNKHPIVEKFFNVQDEALANFPNTLVYTGNLDKIVGGAAPDKLMSDELEYFSIDRECGDITFNGITRSDISHVFYPQRLATRIRNQFLTLKTRFVNHLNGDLIGEEYDITDQFYTYSTNAKGKVVCEPTKYLNGKFNFIKLPKMSFDGLNFSVKYTFTIDCPSYKLMKALSKYDPKVSIVFENISNTTITYYTIIRTKLGVSIYHCPEGNKLVRRPR